MAIPQFKQCVVCRKLVRGNPGNKLSEHCSLKCERVSFKKGIVDSTTHRRTQDLEWHAKYNPDLLIIG